MAKSKYPRWQPDETPKSWRKKANAVEQHKLPKSEKIINPRDDFLRNFKALTSWRSPYSIWRDFVIMTACSFSNVFDKEHFQKREEQYLRLINQYPKEDQGIFPQLLAATTMALELNPEQDFLGEMFMNLGVANKNSGQFFTPYHICELMAMTTVGNVMEQVRENGYITIHDPCCGGGATLIAGVNVARRQLEKEGINFQNHVFVTAQDIDQTVASMCYIQLSLLGIAGFVKIGNALTEPMAIGDSTDDYWFTPMYFSEVWRTRRMIDQFKELMRGEP